MPKEIHAILTETLACFLPGRAKELICTPLVPCTINDNSLPTHSQIVTEKATRVKKEAEALKTRAA